MISNHLVLLKWYYLSDWCLVITTQRSELLVLRTILKPKITSHMILMYTIMNHKKNTISENCWWGYILQRKSLEVIYRIFKMFKYFLTKAELDNFYHEQSWLQRKLHNWCLIKIDRYLLCVEILWFNDKTLKFCLKKVGWLCTDIDNVKWWMNCVGTSPIQKSFWKKVFVQKLWAKFLEFFKVFGSTNS